MNQVFKVQQPCLSFPCFSECVQDREYEVVVYGVTYWICTHERDYKGAVEWCDTHYNGKVAAPRTVQELWLYQGFNLFQCWPENGKK